MEVRKSYCIVKESIAIIPRFDSYGRLHSTVIEGTSEILVQMSPLQIIEYTLLSYGGSLKGAIRATKFHLGRKNMLPIKISHSIGFYWFPIGSLRSTSCIWLAERHIENLEKLNAKTTIIHLSYGHTFPVDMKEKHLWNRIQRARNLRFIIENQVKEGYLNSKESGFQIVKEEAKINYTIKKK